MFNNCQNIAILNIFSFRADKLINENSYKNILSGIYRLCHLAIHRSFYNKIKREIPSYLIQLMIID